MQIRPLSRYFFHCRDYHCRIKLGESQLALLSFSINHASSEFRRQAKISENVLLLFWISITSWIIVWGFLESLNLCSAIDKNNVFI